MSTKYKRTFSPGQKLVSEANQEIDFWIHDVRPDRNCNVQFLHIETFNQPLRFKINKESTIHWIDSGSEMTLQNINIDKITILDAGAEFYYTAMSTE